MAVCHIGIIIEQMCLFFFFDILLVDRDNIGQSQTAKQFLHLLNKVLPSNKMIQLSGNGAVLASDEVGLE